MKAERNGGWCSSLLFGPSESENGGVGKYSHGQLVWQNRGLAACFILLLPRRQTATAITSYARALHQWSMLYIMELNSTIKYPLGVTLLNVIICILLSRWQCMANPDSSSHASGYALSSPLAPIFLASTILEASVIDQTSYSDPCYSNWRTTQTQFKKTDAIASTDHKSS